MLSKQLIERVFWSVYFLFRVPNYHTRYFYAQLNYYFNQITNWSFNYSWPVARRHLFLRICQIIIFDNFAPNVRPQLFSKFKIVVVPKIRSLEKKNFSIISRVLWNKRHHFLLKTKITIASYQFFKNYWIFLTLFFIINGKPSAIEWNKNQMIFHKKHAFFSSFGESSL